MSIPAPKMKPEFDRTDTLQCTLDNILNKCHDVECQKSVLRHYAYAAAREAARNERERIRQELDSYADSILQQAEEQREESMKLIESAQEIKAMLELPCLRNYDRHHQEKP